MPKELVPDLSICNTGEQLAVALGVTHDELIALASIDATSLYRVHRIPKRSKHRRGEFRTVYEPLTEQLKYFHKTLGRRLSLFAGRADPTFPHPSSFGYRRRKSIRDNAAPHCGGMLLFKTDIENFFPSIGMGRVKAILLRLKVPDEGAELLAKIYCVAGHLTLGLSGSPLFANLACHELDSRLSHLSRQYRAHYSRYADDLSFSGDQLPKTAEVASAVEAEGFVLSTKKSRTTKRGQAQFVTGLSVGDTVRPHVPKATKHRLRQELYYCKQHGIDDHFTRIDERPRKGLMRLDGLVRYVSFIERDTAHDYVARWEALLTRDDKQSRAAASKARDPITRTCVIDETAIDLKDARV